MCVCASVGAWAEGDSDGYYLSFDTWFQNVSSKTEFAAKIHLTKGGVLGNAIAELQTGEKKGSWWPQGSSSASEFSYSDCKILYINGESITDDDLTALANLDIETIVLQDVTWAASSKMFTNQYVKNLILPDNWTKEEVNAIGAAIGAVSGNQLGSCFSRGDYLKDSQVTHYFFTEDGETKGEEYTGDVTAVKKEGESYSVDIIETDYYPLTPVEGNPVMTYINEFNNNKPYTIDVTSAVWHEYSWGGGYYDITLSEFDVKLEGPMTKYFDDNNNEITEAWDRPIIDGVLYYGGHWEYNPQRYVDGKAATSAMKYSYTDPFTQQVVLIDVNDSRISSEIYNENHFATIDFGENTKTFGVSAKYNYTYTIGDEIYIVGYDSEQPEGSTKGVDRVETKQLLAETGIETLNLGSIINAYVNRGNTLRDATLHAFLDQKPNTALGNWNKDAQQMHNVVAASISGNAVALDIAGGSVVAQSDGHFKYDKEADEMGDDYGDAVGGGTRTLQGTEQPGALFGAILQKLDLEDAIIEDEYCEDITISALNIINDKKSQVIIPTYSGLKTLPADFMNMSTSIRSICIPSNIEVIRTRAFKTIDYIWTTSGVKDPEGQNTRLDNGTQYSKDGEVVYATTDEDFDYNEVPFGGSYTFSSNLKVIERAAFANSTPHVKDVYVLNTVAPECHVDAFNTQMYAGNNGYSPVAQGESIIKRSNYYNGGWITMLHYPRQTTTPNLQRYTDPTREYSIATGDRDGRGAMLYFPNQSEFIRAYNQGTYGYIWNAWNPERTYGSVTNPMEDANSGWVASKQAAANAAFNTYTSGVNHEYTSFYKVNWDGVSTTVAEAGSGTGGVVPYYQVNWNETSYTTATTGNLYPRSEKDLNSDADESGEMTSKDYRGWHQFVLNAYAANTVLEEKPYRLYISDNDWWTFCPTIDMTKKQVMELFGSESTSNLPYVSRLLYVRREYADNTIWLNFSNNLMVYKEQRANPTDQHGEKDPSTDIVKVSATANTVSDDDVVMSAGVPYLIKPFRVADAATGKFFTQFRVFKTTDEAAKLTDATVRKIVDEDLYNKLNDTETLDGAAQIAKVESGLYTVPVFVKGDAQSGTAKESVDGTSYSIGEGDGYNKSTTWGYTFVGSYYLSPLPQYCYYLGKTSAAGPVTFIYNNFTPYSTAEFRWVNQTAVICPTKNIAPTFKVTPASGLNPALWNLNTEGYTNKVTTNTYLEDDSFATTSSSRGNLYNMHFGAEPVVAHGETVVINETATVHASADGKVYSVDGRLKGNSLKGLAKGVYVVNGKKYVVK